MVYKQKQLVSILKKTNDIKSSVLNSLQNLNTLSQKKIFFHFLAGYSSIDTICEFCLKQISV